MQLLKNKTLILIGLLSLAIILVLIVIIYSLFNDNPSKTETSPDNNSSSNSLSQGNTIQVVRTTPANNQLKADYTGKITVLFGSPVTASQVSLSVTPAVSGKISQLTSSSITFSPQSEMLSNTRYSVRLSIKGKQLLSPERKMLSVYSWSFTTDRPSGEELFTPAEVKQFEQVRTAADNAYTARKQKFPFIIYLPYATAHFKVEITSSDIIVITTFAQDATQTQAYRQEALNWIRANGGNPAAISIQYKSN